MRDSDDNEDGENIEDNIDNVQVGSKRQRADNQLQQLDRKQLKR